MFHRSLLRALTILLVTAALTSASILATTPVAAHAADPGNAVTRLAGADRYSTAVAISKATFPTGARGDVYVASGANFPDALSAAPAARAASSPVLLTAANSLPPSVESEIKRLNANRIVLIGGPGAVSDVVAKKLASLTRSKTVVRRSGSDRYETALAVSRASFPSGKVPMIFVVAGQNYPDAVSAAPLAAARKSPIVLAPTGSLTANTIAEIRRLSPGKVVIVGGPSVVPTAAEQQLTSIAGKGNVSRYAGKDRYDTSAKLSAAFVSADAQQVFLAAGTSFPDAIAAGPAAAMQGGSVLLTPAEKLQPSTYNELFRLGQYRATIIGGTSAVSSWVEQETRYAITDAARFLYLVNNYRASHGLGKVDLMTELSMVARDWALTMPNSGLAHNPNYGKLVPADWRLVGEIVAFTNTPGADEMFRMWKESPAHNAIMLNPEVNRVGFEMWRTPDVYEKFNSGDALFARY